MSHRPVRKSPRLKGYDYSTDGLYFVTIVTLMRQRLFGEINDSMMILSDLGALVQDEITHLPTYWQAAVEIDAFVVMPNHVHMIVILSSNTNNQPTLGQVIGGFKAGVTRKSKHTSIIDGSPWQSRYHDHIIRDQRGLDTIRAYIESNPARWHEDSLFDVFPME